MLQMHSSQSPASSLAALSEHTHLPCHQQPCPGRERVLRPSHQRDAAQPDPQTDHQRSLAGSCNDIAAGEQRHAAGG